MKRKSNVAIGPGAASLILIVVILSMGVLGMLALMNARNDARLSSRSTAVVVAGYELNDRAERRALSNGDDAFLTAVRGRLPEGMLMDGRMVSWSETDGLRTLSCAVEVLPLGDGQRLAWRTHRMTAVTEEIWN